MKILKKYLYGIAIFSLTLFNMYFVLSASHMAIPMPPDMAVSASGGTVFHYERNYIATLAETFKIPMQYAKTLYYGAKIVNDGNPREVIEPILMGSLYKTESGFNPNAISPKGYKGIHQGPKKIDRPEFQMLEGMFILKEKYRYSKGDTYKALSRYKGSETSSVAQEQAKEVLQLKKKKENIIKEKMREKEEQSKVEKI